MNILLNTFAHNFVATYAFLIGMVCMGLLMLAMAHLSRIKLRQGKPAKQARLGFVVGIIGFLAFTTLFASQHIAWTKGHQARENAYLIDMNSRIQADEQRRANQQSMQQAKIQVWRDTAHVPNAPGPSSFDVQPMSTNSQQSR